MEQNHIYFGTIADSAQNTSFVGSVYAYDTQSNRQLWKRQVDGGVQSTPVVSDGLVYVDADKGSHNQASIVALDAATGTIAWQQPLVNSFADDFCFSNGVIYVANDNYGTNVTTPNQMYALNASDGRTLWQSAQVFFANLVPTA